MKKTVSMKLMAALVMLLLPLLMGATEHITYTATYGGSPTLGTRTLGGVTYTTVNYDGLFNDGEPGKPSLPVDYIKLSVPYNATNFTVTATLQDNMISNLSSYLVYPCQPARLMNDTTPIVITPPDSSVYNSSSYYPSQNAWVVDEGFLAGENHIVTVAVMPVSYKRRIMGNFTTNQLRKSGTVRLVLSYELTEAPAMYQIIRKDTTLRQEGYALTRSMVANPDNVLFNAPTDINMNPLDPNSLNPGDGLNGGVNPPNPPSPDPFDPNPFEIHNYPYLIVTTSNLVHSLRRLAALKRQKGYEVKIVTIDEVRNDPHAYEGDIIKKSDGTYYVAYGDSAGSLRQYLKNAYKYWGTKYVLFVGQDVPYRSVNIYFGNEFIPNLPTDLYFGDFHSEWLNPVNESKIDRNPELYVGRILSICGQENYNYTDKLLRYELNPGKGSHEYLSRILYSEGLDMQKDGEANYVHLLYSRLFNDTTHIKEKLDIKFPSGTDIINRINARPVGYLSFLNHAGPSGFTTYGHRQDFADDTVNYYLWAVDSLHIIYDNVIYTKDHHLENGFNNLKNKWFPNICYSIGCTTMPYNRAANYENVSVNIGHSFTTGKDYGGPAFLGNTRKGVRYQISSYLENRFANQILIGNNKIGMAEALSKTEISGTHTYIAVVHNLLGDPEFELWTDEPQQFSNITITRNDNSISVYGIDVDSTVVAYCSNDGKYYRRITSIGNEAFTFNNVSPNGTILLYKHNYIPYIAPLSLQNFNVSQSQYVIANDVEAGNNIDINIDRSHGNVVIRSGVEYEIEASGTVTLRDGFEVEEGTTFAVYPSCF